MKTKPSLHKVKELVPEAGNLEEVASGGFKVVYKALVNGKLEAVKLVEIPGDETDSSVRDENARRVKREVDILGKCTNPCLVKLGSIAPRPCGIDGTEYVLYSEEYIPGDSLRTMIRSDYRPPKDELIELGVCMTGVVRELAAMNVIHRDIKPDNIINTGNAKRPFVLLDLGVAFQIGGTRITRDSRSIPGTLYYIAPEMLDQGFRQNLDYRADLYALGLTLYEFASGNNPFARCDDVLFTTLHRIKTEKPKPLRLLRADLPGALCNLVDQLMKKIPALRPASFDQVITQMEALR